MTSEYQNIKYEVADRVLTITLNRPERLNAYTVEMGAELCEALDRAEGDDDVRAVIFTGAGRAFCAGQDLGAGEDTFKQGDGDHDFDPEANRDNGGQLNLRFYEFNKPMIAAINGPAVGVGATMTLPMDVRLISSAAKMGFVFARRGIVPDGCASWFLPKIVGVGQALEWVMTGRVFGPQEALDGGLARSIHPPDELLGNAVKLAREITDNASAVSVAWSRHLIWKMAGAEHPMEAHKVESRGVYYSGKSADAKEGVSSFLEKRKAEFTDSPAHDMPAYFPWWDMPEFE